MSDGSWHISRDGRTGEFFLMERIGDPVETDYRYHIAVLPDEAAAILQSKIVQPWLTLDGVVLPTPAECAAIGISTARIMAVILDPDINIPVVQFTLPHRYGRATSVVQSFDMLPGKIRLAIRRASLDELKTMERNTGMDFGQLIASRLPHPDQSKSRMHSKAVNRDFNIWL